MEGFLSIYKKYEIEVEELDIQIGDIVKLKKPHPCGNYEWEVLRVGIDFRLKCLGCGHQVMLPRKQVERNLKQVRGQSDQS